MYTQYKLPYGYSDLEPVIDPLTMETHYTKHHAAYTANLNKYARQANAQDMEITELLASLSKIDDAALRNELRNNGGGFYNHNLYFSTIGPVLGKTPSGILAKKIDETFGSFDSFQKEISELANKKFGSGWAWLSATPDGELVLSSSSNQDNPIILGTGNTPILAIDVWEHAYYLQYLNRRADYVTNFFDIIDWDAVEKNYEKVLETEKKEKKRPRATANKYAGTKTEQNLLKAFAGESEARNKYTYFAAIAKKAGYEQIASYFLQTADNEKEHAKLWFKELGLLGDTASNLLAAANGEHAEWTDIYEKMARDAEEEGFTSLALKFRGVGAIEKTHEERFQKLLNNIEARRVFERAGLCIWECRNCGHITIGTSAPIVCPICAHPQSFFELRKENY